MTGILSFMICRKSGCTVIPKLKQNKGFCAEHATQTPGSKVGVTISPDWLKGTVDHYFCNTEPDMPITAAFVFVTAEGHMALTRVVKRGWDLPGGHVDPGEEAVDAALRELDEETSCIASEATPVAYAHVLQEPTEKYPDAESAMMFYATETVMQPLSPSLECDAAEWVPFDKIREYCADKAWFPIAEQIFPV